MRVSVTSDDAGHGFSIQYYAIASHLGNGSVLTEVQAHVCEPCCPLHTPLNAFSALLFVKKYASRLQVGGARQAPLRFSPACWGFATSSDKCRIEAHVRRAVRLNLCQDTDRTASQLAEDEDDTVRKHSSQFSTCFSPPPAKPNSPLIQTATSPTWLLFDC